MVKGGRATRSDCDRVIKILEGPIWMYVDNSVVDEILVEKDLFNKIKNKYNEVSNVKMPDCAWHRKSCMWMVVEIKTSNLYKALEQLNSFYKNFPEIHRNVVRYYIATDRSKVGRYIKKKKYKCKKIDQRTCKLMVDIGGGRLIEVQIGSKSSGKPVYLLFI